MKKLTLLSLALACTLGFTAHAQDEETTEATEESTPMVGISGSVDVYYRQMITTDNNSGVTPNTSFASGTGFNLGMANIIFSHEGDKGGVVADLVFGPRGDQAVFNSGPFTSGTSGNLVNQLYAYYNISDAVTFTIGNFNTFVGYEVISPAANFNYSTSYMFSWGPFSHSGAKLDFSLTDELSLMVGVFNPTDFTEAWNVVSGDSYKQTYSAGLQLGYSNDNGGVWLNALYGDQDGAVDTDAFVDTIGVYNAGSLFQIDLTTGWNITDDFYLGLNATYNTTALGSNYVYDTNAANVITVIETEVEGNAPAFYGAALYAQYALSDAFSLGVRGEYFGEIEGGYGIIGGYSSGAGNIIDLTLSANYKVGSLTFIPEVRVDLASEKVFMDSNQKASDNLASFLLAAVYSF